MLGAVQFHLPLPLNADSDNVSKAAASEATSLTHSHLRGRDGNLEEVFAAEGPHSPGCARRVTWPDGHYQCPLPGDGSGVRPTRAVQQLRCDKCGQVGHSSPRCPKKSK